METMKVTDTQTGFQWGPCRVTRLFADPKHGVWLMISGKHEQVEIRITKGGRLRVFSKAKAETPFHPL